MAINYGNQGRLADLEALGAKFAEVVYIADGSGNQITSFGGTSATSAARTAVSDTATDTLLLEANTSRKGATIMNDSSGTLLIGLGTATVTSADHTFKCFSSSYYEVPAGFTGQIRGIWLTDPNDGGARITELT